MRRRGPAALVALGLAAPLVWLTPAQAVTGAAAPYDFNGDRYPELAVGAPYLRVGSVRDTGGVVVLPASSSGLSTKEKVITQSSRGVPGGSEKGDEFGYALASADFNRDGYADLAIGQPGETAGDVEEHVGSVTVVYGSRSGLDTSTSVSITRTGSRYLGLALAAGDFTGDGYPDLAVGSPGEDHVGFDDADYGPSGVVHVVAGGARGLGAADAVVLRRITGSALGGFDLGFGAKLAAGDLNRDGVADLVVGADGDRYIDDGYPGSVSGCLGARGGPAGCTRLDFTPYLANMSALAVGNVAGSARPEIIVGTALYSEEDGGRVTTLQLTDSGPLALARSTEITQDSPGVPGSDEFDGFGSSVAVGDIDRDGYADLVVGSDREDDDRGRVTVVRGGSGGYARSGNYTYDQSTKGVPGTSEAGDYFGSAVALRDHDRDGDLDLSVGAAGEDGDDGAVTTLKGSGRTFTTSGAKAFGPRSLGYEHPDGGYFGEVLGQ